MSRTIPRVAPLVGMALMAVACGGSSTSPSPAATRAVTAAVSRLANEPFRERVTLRSTYTSTGIPAAIAARVIPPPTQTTLIATLESSRRLKALETNPALGTRVRDVFFDGASYVAVSGSRYRRLTGAAGASGANFIDSLLSVFHHAGQFIVGVRALGVASVDGQATDHYAGTGSQTVLSSVISRFAGLLGAHANPDAVHFTASRIDVYVSRATGQIVRQTTVIDLTIDLSKVATGTPGPVGHGTLKVHQETTTDVYDAGAKLRVHPPQAAVPLSA